MCTASVALFRGHARFAADSGASGTVLTLIMMSQAYCQWKSMLESRPPKMLLFTTPMAKEN
jgi:hypothetical protein